MIDWQWEAKWLIGVALAALAFKSVTLFVSYFVVNAIMVGARRIRP